MAFLLTQIDDKPMRLKGRNQFAGIAVSDIKESLEKGRYRGLRTGKVIELLSVGGRVFPSQDAVLAYSISNPIPVAIDDDIRAVSSPLEEVFVAIDKNVAFQEMSLPVRILQSDVASFWIPVRFNQFAAEIGSGWIRQKGTHVDVLLISDNLNVAPGDLQVIPIYAPESMFTAIL